MPDWESAERVQKNDAGEYRALIGGTWVPVAKAQKNEQGQFRVMKFDQPQVQQPTQPIEPQESDAIGSLLRGTALAGRAAAKGLAALPGLAAEGAAAPFNLASYFTNRMLGTSIPKSEPSAFLQSAIDRLYSVQPETAPERLASAGLETVGGTAPFVKRGLDIASAASAGIGSEAAKESGAGPLGQLAAGLAAGVAPSGLARIAQPIAAKQAAKVAQKQIDTAIKRESAKAAKESGYIIPPSEIGAGKTARIAEGLSGSPKIKQMAIAKNEAVTNRLIKKELGIPEDVPLSAESIESVKLNAGKAYDDLSKVGMFSPDKTFENQMKALQTEAIARAKYHSTNNPEFNQIIDDLSRGSFESDDMIRLMKELRASANANLKQTAEAKPAQQSLGKFQKEAAKMLEDLVSRNLDDANKAFPGYGYGDISSKWKAARETLAKTFNVERAYNPETGNVDARKLGDMLRQGKRFTGGLEQAAKFGRAFPDIAGIPKATSAIPVTTPEAAFGLATALHSPWMLAVPAARSATRYALTGPLQRVIQPQMPELGMLSNTMSQMQPIMTEDMLRNAAMQSAIFGSQSLNQ